MLIGYFKKIGTRRLVIMVIGNVLIGIGIGIFKFSCLGSDPYSSMVMALAEHTPIEYANLLICVNLLVFSIQLAFGRELIGAGTVVNACFIGYITTFCYEMLVKIFPLPDILFIKIVIVLMGMVITCLGVSLYQTSNVGTSPYDSVSLIMSKRFPKIPYFWDRIITDAICVTICYFLGGIIGLGTLLTVCAFGPIVQFFNTHFTRKLFKDGEDIL